MESNRGIPWLEHISKPALVASTSIFCGLAILTNLFIIITIIVSRLRSSAKHLVILTVCIVALYEACSAISLFAQYYSQEVWLHDGKYLRYIDATQYSVLSSFRVLLMVTICGFGLVNMFVANKRFLTLLSVSMIFASIFYSLVLVLPSEEWDADTSSECYWEVRKVLHSASYFPAATILLVLLIDICIVSCCCSRAFDDVTSPGEKRFPVDIVIATAVFFTFTLPYQVAGAYFSSCSESSECRKMHITRVVTSQWEFVGNFVLPLIWLLCPDVRGEATRIFCCKRTSLHRPVASGNYDMQYVGEKM